MNSISDAATRLNHAETVPAVLDAAYDAFEDILCALRCHQMDDEAFFPGFVFAGCPAAEGRDCLAAAPSLPPPSRNQRASIQPEDESVISIACAIAALSEVLARRLTACAAVATNSEDRSACTDAAGQAAEIRAWLGGVSPP
jgi:hypothetical protein